MNEPREITVVLQDDTILRFPAGNVMLDPAEDSLTVYSEDAMYVTFNWNFVAFYSVGEVAA